MVNLKIKLAQSFRVIYRNRMYIHVFIGVSAHMCMCIMFVLYF
jgi:hypothetical protein